MKKITLGLCLLAAGASVSGCVPVAVTGAATTTGVVAAQERSTGNAMDDAGIKITLNNLYFNHDINDLYKNVNIHVSEGRVLLTGDVEKPDTKIEAVRLAWQAKGVREVIDEIHVNDKTGILDYANDTWISAEIRSRLLVEKNVRSINYNIETVNSIVYLLGIAQDEQELKKVTYIASTTKSVKQVISHVVLKDDPRRRVWLESQQPGGKPTPGGSGQPETIQPASPTPGGPSDAGAPAPQPSGQPETLEPHPQPQ